MRDCKVQVSRGDNRNSNRKRERNESTQNASAGVKTGDDHIIGCRGGGYGRSWQQSHLLPRSNDILENNPS